MKSKFAHPLWAHTAAIAALIVLAIRLSMAGPLPANAPIHFSTQGQPNGYGSPWTTFGLGIGLSLLFVSLSFIADEIWAREEKTKNFNWISLFDDAIVGFLTGVSLGYLDFLTTASSTFSFPWGYILVTMGGAIVLSVILEFLRPFHFYPRKATADDSSVLVKEIQEKLRDTETFTYWQSQNPAWMSTITIAVPLLLIAGAVFAWFSIPWVSIELFVIGIALFIFHGGMRILVTPENITIRFGLLGFKVKQIPLVQAKSVEVHEFSGFRDFGGFGIRFNGQMTAYFLRGSRGVKITNA